MGDRDLILSRIRACRKDPDPKAPLFEKSRAPEKKGSAPGGEPLLEIFCRESEHLFVDVRVARDENELEENLTSLIQKIGAQDIVLWGKILRQRAGLESLLSKTGARLHIIEENPSPTTDDRRDFIRISSEAGLGITGADCALADSGTLVLRHGPGRERSSSLLPPVHVALLESRNILAGLDELLERLQDDIEKKGSLESCITLISGPSKTADIEMTLVHGVHGPGEVHVVVLDY